MFFLGVLINQRQIFLDESASHRMFVNSVQAAAPQTNLPTEDSTNTSEDIDLAEPQKKKRKPNWSQEETLLLVNVIMEKKLIINGRFKPSLSHKDKREAWQSITDAINGTNPLTKRTVEVETKWFSVLSKSRKKISAIKAEYNQSGAGGPQAPPLDPVDMKVEELLGEKNATVIGVIQNDLGFHTLRKLQTQRQEDTEKLGEEPPQQQVEDDSKLHKLHWQSVQVQPQPQQSSHKAQHLELLEDGSFIECTITEPETSKAQPSISSPKLRKCLSVSDEYEQYKAGKNAN
ncbi:myb/SANT-like DNA-binding domain-containing protein 4 isoform X1 [Scylla paramamosain]|uniref:myb/SANT-like DNA-binding domain-containing protein 4 isoform X1 n=1 Tax=Scylla paramamosain TaxID=85552 RepID=UPI003082FA71